MTSARRSSRSAFAMGALFGAATWLAWLGWDRTASYDVVTDSVQTPYVTLQVVGCALTVLLVTAGLATRWPPLACAAGVGLGFWLVWTVDAGFRDETGLFVVGSVMLGAGLTAATILAAVVGRKVQTVVDTRRRGSGDAAGGQPGDG